MSTKLIKRGQEGRVWRGTRNCVVIFLELYLGKQNLDLIDLVELDLIHEG